ncbi:MAG: SRPBCC family protein [Verrucomicrobiae bacterium]|nr:SRPBCC family protein [Verrucomicrobiae bacterium]
MIKKTFWGLLLVFGALFIVATFMPQQWKVEKSTVIQKDASVIYPYVLNFKEWEKWSAWTKEDYDPTITYSYEGTEGEIGFKQYWQGKRGSGILTLTQFIPNRFVQYRLDMDQYTLNGGIELLPQGSGTLVTWRCYGDNGKNPISKSMQLVFTPLIEEDFRKGLAKLKAQLEQAP